MPYIDKLDDEQQQKDGQDQQVATGEQVIGGGAPTSAAKAQNTASKGSGQFADLGEYLRVNQPQQFGTQLAGKVGGDVAKAEDTVSQAGQEFKSRADQNTVKGDPSLVAAATGDNAANFVTDPNNVKAFGAQRDATYKGPSSFSDTPDLYNQTTGASQTATGKAKAASSEGGRFALLDNYFGRDNYSAGQKSLDNLLVQNDPNARNSFKQVEENAKTVADNQRALAQSDYGAQAKATTEATRAAARNAVGIDEAGNVTDASPISQIYTGLQGKQADYAKAQEDEYARLKGELSAGLLDDQAFAKTGLENETQTLGIDPNDYWKTGAAPTVSSVATADQQKRLAALAQLAGKDNTWLPDSTDIGTYNPQTANTFDSQGFGGALSKQAEKYAPQLEDRQSALDEIARLQRLMPLSGEGSGDYRNGINVRLLNEQIQQQNQKVADIEASLPPGFNNTLLNKSQKKVVK